MCACVCAQSDSGIAECRIKVSCRIPRKDSCACEGESLARRVRHQQKGRQPFVYMCVGLYVLVCVLVCVCVCMCVHAHTCVCAGEHGQLQVCDEYAHPNKNDGRTASCPWSSAHPDKQL